MLLLLALLLQDPQATKLEIASQGHTPPKKWPGEAIVTLGVRNAGAVDGREPTVLLTFFDLHAAPVKKVRVRLAEAIAGLAEDGFEIAVPRCPDYATVKAEVAWLAAEIVSPAELSKAEKVEVGECRIVRLTDGAVRVNGKVRNGRPGAVQNVAVRLKLGSVEAPLDIPGTLKSGTVRDFELYVADCPPFEGFSYTLHQEDCDDPKEVEPEAGPVARRTSHREPSGKQPPPKEPPVPAEKPKAGGITVEVRGLKWVEGYTMVNKKYSGDVAFLRLALKEDGKPVQPTGKLTALLFEGDKSRGQVTRYVKKESWGLDASKIEAKNVSHDIVAYDKGSGELWVGLVRADKFWLELKLDVTLALDKLGTWEWKGLADKCEAKPKGPDRK